MRIGAHVSIAENIIKAPLRAKKLGCEIFQIFSRSPQGGKIPRIDFSLGNLFQEELKKQGFQENSCYLHSPYFINLASTNNKIFYNSIEVLVRELKVASWLKAQGVVTHLGSSTENSSLVLERLIKAFKEISGKISQNYPSLLLLENSAGSGHTIGSSLREIGELIKKTPKLNFSLGFCLDTCHAFAAGYNLSKEKELINFFNQIEKEVGLGNLKLIHLNESRTERGTRIDRHAHLKEGKIGFEGIKNIIKKALINQIDLVIETKHDKIKEDIELVKKIRHNL